MLKNHVKIALRILRKQLGYSVINVTGLAIGLTCFILIGLFAKFELSYDTFHEKADRIYRIEEVNKEGFYQGNNTYAVTPAPMAETLVAEFPEVEHAVYIDKVSSLLEFGAAQFFEDGLVATGHFFDVFDFDLLEGNPATALSDPNAIVLTEALAQKYFGNTPAIGEVLTVTHAGPHGNEARQMTVTGIVQNVPANSHISFDYISPFVSSAMYLRNRESWGTSTSYTYAALQPGHSLASFTENLLTLSQKYDDQLDQEAQTYYYPKALTDIHLRSSANFELGVNGDIRFVYLFMAIALLILLIACFNYINLATARSVTRAMEVGVRKVMGAERRQLIAQFMSEAIVPSLLALVIALGLVKLLLPTFNALTLRSITISLAENGSFLVLLVLVGLGIGILSGSYPALLMSRFNPLRMMKKQLDRKAGKARFRNMLVVVQFAVTIILIVSTIGIQRQLHYIQNANLGVNRSQVIVIPVRDVTMYTRFDVVRQALENHQNVLAVTASESDPTMIDMRAFTRDWEGIAEGQEVATYFTPIQPGFIDLFEIEVVEGRDFSAAITSDIAEGMLINETFRDRLGWDTAVGKRINLRGREANVIGVVEDFNFQSFRQDMEPLALFIEQDWYTRLLVKVRGEDVQGTLASLEETMGAFSPGYPFQFYFLDDAYNRVYQSDIRMGNIFSYFTFLALFLACMGLLGLATLTAQQRTKEIGVRKVLGASLSDILILLTRDYTRLVVVAFVLAAPVGYIMISGWLGEFSYGISIGWGTLLLAGVAVLLIAWSTVSYQLLRVALINPVNSLNHE